MRKLTTRAFIFVNKNLVYILRSLLVASFVLAAFTIASMLNIANFENYGRSLFFLGIPIIVAEGFEHILSFSIIPSLIIGSFVIWWKQKTKDYSKC